MHLKKTLLKNRSARLESRSLLRGEKPESGGPGHLNCVSCALPYMKSCGEYDFGMEQRAGYPGGDGDQFPLALEDLYLAGAGEFGEVDGAAGADAGGGGFVGGY